MRRTGFTPKPTWKRLSRGTGMKRTTRMNPVSEKRKVENRERAQIPMADHCEAHRAGMPGECFGPLTRHEVLPRARGGSITDPANIRTVAAECNRRISQEPEAMRWALANGFLKHGFKKVGE